MIQIRIDDQRCDLLRDYALPGGIFTFDGGSLESPSQKSTGREVEIEIPSSPTNDQIMGHATDPCTGEIFNQTLHEAAVIADGVVLLRGEAQLVRVEGKGSEARYIIRISDGAGDWVAKLDQTPIGDTQLGWSERLDAEGIVRSWDEGAVVRFLPVRYDDYREPHDSTSLFPPQRAMSVADYHPFISVEGLLRAMFEEAGYEVVSDFMQGEEFRSLLISGAYPTSERSLSRLVASSGFLAGRTGEASTTADQMGRAWLTPLVLTNSLGNFVQTTQGEGMYNNSGVLTITDSGAEYRPKVAVSTGFELLLRYTTDCRMISSARMEGFDSLYVDAGCDLHFPLQNPYPDRRSTASAGVSYRCVVFDYQQGESLRLVCNTGDGESVLATFSARSTTVTIPSSATDARCTLQIESESSFTDYEGDWALYDGYVEDESQMEVEVTLYTPAEALSPSAAKSFNRMYLHGATEGQSITLSKECTLRPLFTATPAEGELLTLTDIAAHDFSQGDLLRALQQMFNLRIATDVEAATVSIEPYDDFYNGTNEDWSQRAIAGEPIVARLMADGKREQLALCYRTEGDGAVARYNQSSGEVFGQWLHQSSSYLADQGVEQRRNKLFCPTLNATGIFHSAPSASIMQVGDRDADQVAAVATRIVRYAGMRPLPAQERWGYPSFGREYPYAAFHSPGEFTLCFEDRDSAEGLHHRYDREFETKERRCELELSLRIEPHTLRGLITQSDREPSIRSRYRLNLTGQRATYHISAVESYDAVTQVARCRMARSTDD